MAAVYLVALAALLLYFCIIGRRYQDVLKEHPRQRQEILHSPGRESLHDRTNRE